MASLTVQQLSHNIFWNFPPSLWISSGVLISVVSQYNLVKFFFNHFNISRISRRYYKAKNLNDKLYLYFLYTSIIFFAKISHFKTSNSSWFNKYDSLTHSKLNSKVDGIKLKLI